MSAYIDRTYIENTFSPAIINSLLSYGEVTTTAQQNAKLDQLISASSDIIDSFLTPAGYDLPLTTVPNSIKKTCSYLVVNDLFATTQQPIPEYYSNEISAQYSYLNALRKKELILTGNEQNTTTGTGGNVFEYNLASTSEPKRIMDYKSLRGKWV